MELAERRRLHSPMKSSQRPLPPGGGVDEVRVQTRNRIGGGVCGISPPPSQPSQNRSASSSGFPLGKPDPQGGVIFYLVCRPEHSKGSGSLLSRQLAMLSKDKYSNRTSGGEFRLKREILRADSSSSACIAVPPFSVGTDLLSRVKHSFINRV